MNQLKVLIAGTFQESEAYPNVKHRLRLIEQSNLYEVTRRHKQLNTRINYRSRLQRTLCLIRLAADASHKSISIVSALARDKSSDVAYLPYPATLLLWTISLLPRRYHPKRMVVALFISLYDTVITDRRLFRNNSFIATLLFAFEKRALSAATVLLTDTPENADYYAKLFSIDRSVFIDIPLSIDNSLFTSRALTSARSHLLLELENQEPSTQITACHQSTKLNKLHSLPFRILYVGTLVPLHNIGLLCKLVRELKTTRPVEFRFVGNGQDAKTLEQLFLDHNDWPSNISCTWEQRWQDAAQIREHIDNADLCIGLLGTEGKSQRVWPIKNYLYMAGGKPLITARTPVTERLVRLANSDLEPFMTVNPAVFEELQSAIHTALNKPDIVRQTALNALDFHLTYHSDEPVAARLYSALSGAS